MINSKKLFELLRGMVVEEFITKETYVRIVARILDNSEMLQEED